jgi:hypothetical protein
MEVIMQLAAAIDSKANRFAADILGTTLIPELALVQALGIAPRTFAGIVARGRGPAGRVKIGRRVFYRKDAIAKWVVEREQRPGRRARRHRAQTTKSRR